MYAKHVQVTEGLQCSLHSTHNRVLSQYDIHTSPVYIHRAFVADYYMCSHASMNHHSTGPEHLMPTVEKKTVSLYNVKSADDAVI